MIPSSEYIDNPVYSWV